jgi:hypothetical protein
MHRFRSGIVGMALAGAFAGCGGTAVDEGPKPFQSTDIKGANIEPMINEMQKVAKTGAYKQKQVVPSEKEKTKESEKK